MEETELCFPQLFNLSCRRPKRSHLDAMLVYILLPCISLLTVILNLLVIISISHFKQLHSPTNLLLLSLAVSDFLVGFLMFFHTVLIDSCWFLGDLMCVLYYCLAYITTTASIGTMVMISGDRYVAICYPLQYPVKVTHQRVKIGVSLCWIWAVLMLSLTVQDILKKMGMSNSCIGQCVFVSSDIARYTDVIMILIFPITVIIVLYVRVFMVAVSQARSMRSHMAAVSLKGSVRPAAKRSELKAARTLGVVVVVFVICICPFHCVGLTSQDIDLNSTSATVVIYLFYFNSSLNPIIYTLFYPWFRKAIKLIVTLQILQPNSCGARML